MLNCGVGGGGVGGDEGEGGEAGGGMGGVGNCEMCCLIKLTTLLGETRACSSFLSHKGEIKGLFSNSTLPLWIFLLRIIPNINVFL